MDYFKIIDDEQQGEERSLGVVGIDIFSGEPIPELQLQVAQDGNDAYIDLTVDDVQRLVNKLNEFLTIWKK